MAHRNRECKRRALIHCTLDPDAPAMEFDELPRQGQTKPGALDLLGGRPDLLELLEDRFLILGGNTHASVADRYLNKAVHRFRADLDVATLRRKLDRIRQKIEKHLADLALVRLNLSESFVDAPVQVDTPARYSLADQHQRIVDRRGEIEV